MGEFTRSTTFPALKRLELSETDLSDRQTAALAEANGLRLTELGLRQCAIGNEGLARVTRSALDWFVESARALQ